MKRSRFSDEQIIGILKEQETGGAMRSLISDGSSMQINATR